MRLKVQVTVHQDPALFNQSTRSDELPQLLIVPLFSKSSTLPPDSRIPEDLRDSVSRYLALGDFVAGVGDIALLYPDNAAYPKRVMLIGIGEKETHSAERNREAGAVAGRNCKRHSNIAVLTDDLAAGSSRLKDACRAFLEGFLLGYWERTTADREVPEPSGSLHVSLLINGHTTADIQKACDSGLVIAEAIQLARDVSDKPPTSMPPLALSDLARKIADQSRLQFSSLSRKEMERERLSGLLAVSRGSAEPPAFVILEHAPASRNTKTIVLIGKGITFDSGGLNLKPGSKLPRMKHDKSGVGVILAVMSALAKLHIPLHVVGLLPIAENLPGGAASKPGDVITMADKKTVEIVSTDAEGRLILADALLYARRFFPHTIIDVASLSGATRMALGDEASAIFSNSQQLQEDLIRAGMDTGEPLCPFPLLRNYLKDLRTPFADLRNIPLSTERGGGGCIAAAFLNEFASSRWAHLDTAGTAWDNQSRRYYPKEGGSGFGVRLLIEFLSSLELESDLEGTK